MFSDFFQHFIDDLFDKNKNYNLLFSYLHHIFIFRTSRFLCYIPTFKEKIRPAYIPAVLHPRLSSLSLPWLLVSE